MRAIKKSSRTPAIPYTRGVEQSNVGPDERNLSDRAQVIAKNTKAKVTLEKKSAVHLRKHTEKE